MEIPTWDMKASSCSWVGGMARRAPSVSRSPGHAARCSPVPKARRIRVSPTRNSTLAPAGKGEAHSQETSLPPSVLQLN